jgi:hypothetical protein
MAAKRLAPFNSALANTTRALSREQNIGFNPEVH